MSRGTCQRFRITGRVQGVFFRDSTRSQARTLGLTGYARNEPDGSVDVLACGPVEAVARLAEWLHKGPERAVVDSVEATAAEVDAPGDFTIG